MKSYYMNTELMLFDLNDIEECQAKKNSLAKEGWDVTLTPVAKGMKLLLEAEMKVFPDPQSPNYGFDSLIIKSEPVIASLNDIDINIYRMTQEGDE